MKRKLPSLLACAHPETLVMGNIERVFVQVENGKTRFVQKTVTNEIIQHKRHLQVFFLKFKQQLF